MSDGYEAKCPLCNTPRAKGQKRCVCNYTFEYERESRPFRRISAASAGGAVSTMSLVVVVLGVMAAGLVFAWMQSLTPPPAEGSSIGWFLLPAGLFALAGGLFDWTFFFRSSRARRFVWLFGRSGARAFYGVLGGALAGAGVSLLLA